MSELREAIDGFLNVFIYGDDDLPEYETKRGVINAILDAVIAALPSELADQTGSEYYEGQNIMLNNVKAILIAAKEGK